MGAIADIIRTKLGAALKPSRLEIIDDSARHAGHAGSRSGGETHFNIIISSDAFVGRSRIQRQRLVYEVLADELAGPIHALSLRAIGPGED